MVSVRLSSVHNSRCFIKTAFPQSLLKCTRSLRLSLNYVSTKQKASTSQKYFFSRSLTFWPVTIRTSKPSHYCRPKHTSDIMHRSHYDRATLNRKWRHNASPKRHETTHVVSINDRCLNDDELTTFFLLSSVSIARNWTQLKKTGKTSAVTQNIRLLHPKYH